MRTHSKTIIKGNQRKNKTIRNPIYNNQELYLFLIKISTFFKICFYDKK